MVKLRLAALVAVLSAGFDLAYFTCFETLPAFEGDAEFVVRDPRYLAIGLALALIAGALAASGLMEIKK